MASEPRGQVLKVRSRLDGMSTVQVDNGPFQTVTLHTRTEDLGALVTADLPALVEHLMTRKPGHFWKKAGK
jgi:hypothetical protein